MLFFEHKIVLAAMSRRRITKHFNMVYMRISKSNAYKLSNNVKKCTQCFFFNLENLIKTSERQTLRA